MPGWRRAPSCRRRGAVSFFALTAEPGVRLRLRQEWRRARCKDGASAAGPRGATFPSVFQAPEFAGANERLAAGASLAQLRDTVIAAAEPQRAAAYILLLQRLTSWGALEFPLVDEGGERAVIDPQPRAGAPALAPQPPSAETPLDRFACLRRENGVWLLESPLSDWRFQIADLHALEAPLVRRALAAGGFFEAPQANPRRDALAQWEFHDLLFHSHSRKGFHRDPFGGVFPFVGRIPPPPALRPPWPGERIALASAPDGGREPFARVLERRRSERSYDESRPISLPDLGALFDRALRVRASWTVSLAQDGGPPATLELSRRPYPNGGASYELEIYPVVDRCDGLAAGFYHYDAASHELVRLSGRTPEVEQVLADARTATGQRSSPQVVLVIAARFARVMWTYKAIAYGIVLRNTGALYQTLYLAATELGLSPCGVGYGDAALFASMTGLDPAVEGSVGDFILGGPPVTG